MGWVLEGLSKARERFIAVNRPYPEFGVAVYPDPGPGCPQRWSRITTNGWRRPVTSPSLARRRHLGERMSPDSRVVVAESSRSCWSGCGPAA